MPPAAPTLRSLANEAGVTPMTVSLALRNSQRISRKTRESLQRLATLRGYRPDPTITKLMQHLRMRGPARPQTNICGLLDDTWPGQNRSNDFGLRLHKSLELRARALGFAFDVLPFSLRSAQRGLHRILRQRGIEGIVVLPMPGRRDLSDLIEWSQFAVVSVTTALLAPQFHSVMPNHFDNMVRACQILTGRGYRRIGLAITQDWDNRVRHRWTGALAWQNSSGLTDPVPPFLSKANGSTVADDSFLTWLRRHRPDVVMIEAIDEALWKRALRAWPDRKPPLLATLDWPNHMADEGMDQRVERIGITAVDLLSGLIARGERGVPVEPTITFVDGRWMSVACRHQ